MKTYNDMADEVLRRIEVYETAKKKRRQTLARAATCLGGICVAALVGVGVWKSGLLSAPAEQPATSAGAASSAAGGVESLPPDRDVLWGNEGSDGLSNMEGFAEWNGLHCSSSLYGALQRCSGENVTLAVAVSLYDPTVPDTFVFDGKSYAEWTREYEELRQLDARYAGLYKEGEDLKYGEALCTTGNAEGIKWSRLWYEERMAFYGAEFLARYIVNGEFLLDRLVTDGQQVAADLSAAQDTLTEAREAFRRQWAEDELPTFLAMGVPAETINGTLCLYVTAEELAALPLEEPSAYLFWHAGRADEAEDLITDF